MEAIKILPHHAISIFEVFYLDWKPEEVISWYNDPRMKQNGVDAVKTMVSNPNQLIQVVNTYDEICRMCPHHKKGDNYDRDDEVVCHTYDNADVSDSGFAEILGLEKVLDKGPISAKTFFELMKPTYDKLMFEPEFDRDNKRKSLHQIFRVPLTMKISNLSTNESYSLVKG